MENVDPVMVCVAAYERARRSVGAHCHIIVPGRPRKPKAVAVHGTGHQRVLPEAQEAFEDTKIKQPAQDPDAFALLGVS